MEMKRLKLDILGISEMRWHGTGDFWTGDYRVIYSGTEEGLTGRKGVGVIMERSVGTRVVGYVQHSDRILLVKINTKPNNTVIIQTYMPTTNDNDEEIERIYEELNDMIDGTLAEDNVIVIGDMNATVGEGAEGATVGKYGLGKRNERGTRLIEFCTRNKLVITNTLFNHHKRRRYTWKAPGDIKRAQLDYIMVKERFKNQVKNCRSYPGADIVSDHNLVMMHVELKYKKIIKTKNKYLEMTKLKIPSIKEEFQKRTDEIVKADSVNKPIEEQWRDMMEEILGTAEELLRNKKETKRKTWISEEVVEMISERRKLKSDTTEEGKQQYKRLRNEIVRKSRRDKEKYLSDICDDIDKDFKANNLDKAYGKVKSFMGEKKKRTTGIKDRNGQYIYEEKKVAKRWKEYLEGLYGDESMDENAIEEEDATDIENKGDHILKSEFQRAMKMLKNNKAPGVDKITAEILNNCGEKAKYIIYEMIRKMYDTGIVPTDFNKCIIIPIPKTLRAQNCDQFRTLSLTTHASKVLTSIILRRMEKILDNYLTDDQFGFRRNIGTREAILTLRQIIEKRNKKGEATYIAFVDLEKAFDSVNWNIMFRLLKKVGISYRDRRIIYSLYKNEKGIIRFGNIQEEAEIKKGVRQGCSLSPYLFNVYVQEAINRIREEIQVGINIHGEKIDMLRYADDIAITTENEGDLQNILQVMNNIMRNEFNMKMNRKKTKILVCSRNQADHRRTPVIYIENERIQNVQEYKYLGSLITKDGTSKGEIRNRIMQAKSAFNRKKNLFTTKNIDLNIRKRLLKTYVWSVALYGSETWTIGRPEEKKLMAFETWCWRRMMKVSWREHMTNEEVFKRANESRSFMRNLKTRRANMIGHTLRHNGMLARAIEGMVQGKNTRGRPPLAYIDQILKDTNTKTYFELKRLAEDREEWRVAANQPQGC